MQSLVDRIHNLASQLQKSGAATPLVIAVSLGVLVVGACWISWGSAQTKLVPLFDGAQLLPAEIRKIQLAFAQAGLNDSELQGSQVLVPEHRRSSYLKAVSDFDAVPADPNAVSNGDWSDWFVPQAERAQIQKDRKKELIRAMVIRMNFVRDALVDYDETRADGPFGGIQRSALVTIMPEGQRTLEPHEIKAVRDMVRGAVAGLQTQDIVITDVNANRSYSSSDAQDAEENEYLSLKRYQESRYESKIRDALSAYRGVRVNVDVELDPVLRRRQDQRQVDGPSVPLTTTVQREMSRRQAAPLGTQTDALLAGTNGAVRLATDNGELIYERTLETSQTVPAATVTTTEMAGPLVRRVNVSIGVSEKCVRQLYERQQPQIAAQRPPSAAELDEYFQRVRAQIQEKILPLVGLRGEQTAVDNQLVVTMDPDVRWDAFSQPAAATNSSAVWANGNWQLALLLIGGVFAVVAVWAMPTWKNRAVARATQATPSPSAAAGPDSRPAETRDPETMAADLSNWIENNPAVAARLMRQWIDAAA